MNFAPSFDDVLIVPQYSRVASRKEVGTATDFLDMIIPSPILCSNMDSVTSSVMANAIREAGGLGTLHRFCSVSQNLSEYMVSPKETIVSIGLGEREIERAYNLYTNGARNFLLDVAHGASEQVAKASRQLKTDLRHIRLIVGNFATAESINDFMIAGGQMDAAKVGIGGGSACTTRLVTGCGLPTLASLLDCRKHTLLPLIADGGIRNSGDYAKALSAGASMVMIGKLFCAAKESPAPVVGPPDNLRKVYRGSASAPSYAVQGKEAAWRTPEGEAYKIIYRGETVAEIVQKLNAGLRSAMSYVGAYNLQELRENTTFMTVSAAGAVESGAHGQRS